MEYRLEIHRITKEDIRVDRPDVTEEDNFQMYIDAFREDIENIKGVISVKNGMEFLTVEVQHSDLSAFRSDLKILITNYWSNFKVSYPPELSEIH